MNGEPRTLIEIINHEALGYRAWGTPEGEFLARQMERLAQLIRYDRGEHDPKTMRGRRLEVSDAEMRDRYGDMGSA